MAFSFDDPFETTFKFLLIDRVAGYIIKEKVIVIMLWGVRKAVLPILSNLPGPKRSSPFVEDAAVPVAATPSSGLCRSLPHRLPLPGAGVALCKR